MRLLKKIAVIFAGSFIGILVFNLLESLYSAMLVLGSVAKQHAIFPGANNLLLDVRTHIQYPKNVEIGHDVIIGSNCQIGAMAMVKIGDMVRISRGVTIQTASLDFSSKIPYKHIAKPITIAKGVWIGTGSIILGGVNIGEYAVIGAGSVISQDVPARAVIVGSSNRVFIKG